MSVKQHVIKPLLLLRKWVKKNTKSFGKSRWDFPASQLLYNDEKSVGDVIESLEEELTNYRAYIEQQKESMDDADNRGSNALIASMEKVIAYAKILSSKYGLHRRF